MRHARQIVMFAIPEYIVGPCSGAFNNPSLPPRYRNAAMNDERLNLSELKAWQHGIGTALFRS